MEKIKLAALLLLVFGLYLFTLFPAMAPYRDSGEMATVIHTLGVPHPPGYPLYALSGKVFASLFPLGNVAYRANVLSALASALTILFLYLGIRKYFLKFNSAGLALAAVLIFATSYLQWYLSLVSEMYTINTFFAALLFYIYTKWEEARELKYIYLFCFISGMGLGNRMDLLLIMPGFLLVFLFYGRVSKISTLGTCAITFLLGFSVFLYLPARASQFPLIDWNHPAMLEKLIDAITRKSHGSTLDLLSTNYAKGENFPAGIGFYFKHLFAGFAYIGIILGALGAVKLYKTNKPLFYSLSAAFIIAGPVFIFLGNMPPNTHALAILEAHFLLPNTVFFIFALFGLLFILEKISSEKPLLKYACLAGLSCFALLNAAQNYEGINKRNNYFTDDFSRNVFRSAPPNSIVVLKEDVQLFSLWFSQYILNHRKDVVVVGQGLSGSLWYQDMLRRQHPDACVGALKTEQDWLAMERLNPKRDLLVSTDAEIPGFSTIILHPHGLMAFVKEKKLDHSKFNVMNELYGYRGTYRYGAHREFFTPDLIEDYAKSRHRQGYYYMINKNYPLAQEEFLAALYLHDKFPVSAFHLGYTYFDSGDYKNAMKYYNIAADIYRYQVDLSRQYNSLEGVKRGILGDLAELYVNMGVTTEKLGDESKSLEYYTLAGEVSPGFTKSYFNKAVIYWRHEDWPNVIRELERAVSIDPNYAEARRYLEVARYKQSQKGGTNR